MSLAGRHTATSSGSTVAQGASGRHDWILFVERVSVLHPAYSTHVVFSVFFLPSWGTSYFKPRPKYAPNDDTWVSYQKIP